MQAFQDDKITKKALLRDQARKHIALTDVLSEDVDNAATLLFDGLDLSGDEVIAVYWPKGREFDPTAILEGAADKEFTCALPVVEKGTKILGFKKWNKDTQLQKSTYGIMEPQNTDTVEPDIIIVPLLAFDRKGYRLGQGGGYYDATLKHWRSKKDIIAIGTGYAAQAVLFNLPVEEHDQKMDYILTPLELRKI